MSNKTQVSHQGKQLPAQKAAGAAIISTSIKLSDKELAPTRDIKQVLRDRVKMLPGHVGLTLADETTLAECLQILGYTLELRDGVQFLIGDVINFGYVKWGEKKYRQAMEQTGRAYDTLRHYSETARRIPRRKRLAHLSYSHHAEIVRLPGELINAQLERLSKIEANDLPTAHELREQIKALMPSRKQAEDRPMSDELTDAAEPDDSAAQSEQRDDTLDSKVSSHEAPKPQSKGWQSDDLLTTDRLIPEELEIVAKFKAYAKRRRGRALRFKRSMCDGDIL